MIDIPEARQRDCREKSTVWTDLMEYWELLDYVSGSVSQRNVAVDDDYSVLITDMSEAFQVLMYAYLYLGIIQRAR
jgi:hypothetical protein